MLRFIIAMLLAVSFPLHPSGSTAGDVVVELRSGRRVRATTIRQDPRDAARLVAEYSEVDVRIERLLLWSAIRSVEAEQSKIQDLKIPEEIDIVLRDKARNPPVVLSVHESDSCQDQRDAVQKFLKGRSPFKTQVQCDSADPKATVILPVIWIEHSTVLPTNQEHHQAALGTLIEVRDTSSAVMTPREYASLQPRELNAWARPFNRSGLSDWDSLELYVQGRTTSGLACPVRGLVRCSLWGRRQSLVHGFGDSWIEDGRDIELMRQWSQFVEPADADSSGAHRLVLPLAPNIPDHDLTWSGYGLLSVEIDVPGQGRLASLTDTVQLRQAGPIQNRSLEQFGMSILPNQTTSNNTRITEGWPQSLSGLRPDRRLFSVHP